MALRRIALRDFVIVQALELDFNTGFTALTGETGAGKSILIEALQLALGARADAGFVREGAQRSDISAEFDCPASLLPWLDESGFEQEDGLLLRRTIDVQGKSRAWVNGAPATATQLRTLGQQLLDIHGQHAWQSLVRADSIRALLDAYANTSPIAVQTCWAAWRAAQAQVAQAHAARRRFNENANVCNGKLQKWTNSPRRQTSGRPLTPTIRDCFTTRNCWKRPRKPWLLWMQKAQQVPAQVWHVHSTCSAPGNTWNPRSWSCPKRLPPAWRKPMKPCAVCMPTCAMVTWTPDPWKRQTPG